MKTGKRAPEHELKELRVRLKTKVGEMRALDSAREESWGGTRVSGGVSSLTHGQLDTKRLECNAAICGMKTRIGEIEKDLQAEEGAPAPGSPRAFN